MSYDWSSEDISIMAEAMRRGISPGAVEQGRVRIQADRDLAVIARIGGRAITLNRPDVTEADLLYVEHAGGSHTGDYYVTGCPTCDPPETVIERYQREGR